MRRSPVLLLGSLLCAASLPAQYIVKDVAVSGAPSYPDSSVVQLLGLNPGDPIGKSSLDAAAVRLMATGYFADVQSSLDFVTMKDATVRIRLKPVPPGTLLPVSFANFVWLSPAELAAFRTSVPLLSAGLPEAGNREAAVEQALTKLLAAKGVEASVVHTTVEASTLDPHRSISFRVETPSVSLGGAHLAGVPTDAAPNMRGAIAQASRAPYNEGSTGETTASILLAPLFDLGELDATLDITDRRLTPSPSGNGVKVDLDAAVHAGAPYTVSSVSFTPTSVVSAEAFAKTQKLQAGALASRRNLMASVQPVLAAYGAQGYLDAYVDPHAAADPAKHQVAYTLTVVPGEQYRLKSIMVTGLTPAARADFDKYFPLHPGDLYNEASISPFLKNNSGAISLRPFAGAFSAAADPNTHTVDLTLEFHPMGAPRS